MTTIFKIQSQCIMQSDSSPENQTNDFHHGPCVVPTVIQTTTDKSSTQKSLALKPFLIIFFNASHVWWGLLPAAPQVHITFLHTAQMMDPAETIQRGRSRLSSGVCCCWQGLPPPPPQNYPRLFVKFELQTTNHPADVWGKPNDTIDSPADVDLTQHFRKTEFVRGIETDGRGAERGRWRGMRSTSLLCLCRERWVWAAGGFVFV